MPEELYRLTEGVDIEAKEAQGRDGRGAIPDSIWSTYSSFANTVGGTIILGAEELSDRTLRILGVSDPEKIRRDFINAVNDRRKVSRNILTDVHIQVVTCLGKHIVLISVPRAGRHIRPIYVGNNPLTGTYRRLNDADQKCDEQTVKILLAEATADDRTSAVVDHYTIDDLEPETLEEYRRLFASFAGSDHRFLRFDRDKFLGAVGAAVLDRDARVYRPTLAGLLLFGTHASITERFPHFHLDYRFEDPSSKTQRYLDRFIWDGRWSGNLLDFFGQVSRRILSTIQNPFVLGQNMQRSEDQALRAALREALINALIHADYDIRGGVVIVHTSSGYTFENPGTMRVAPEEAFEGGKSDCRNSRLQQIFRLIGLSEQAGSGVHQILSTWNEKCWTSPILESRFDPDRTRLHLEMIDFIPRELAAQLQKLGPPYERLSRIERATVSQVMSGKRITNKSIQSTSGLHRADITAILGKLVDSGFLSRAGRTVGASYVAGPLLRGARDISTKVERSSGFSDIVQKVRNSAYVTGEATDQAILSLCDTWLSRKEISAALFRDPVYIARRIRSLISLGLIEKEFETLRHPGQRYKRVDKKNAPSTFN